MTRGAELFPAGEAGGLAQGGGRGKGGKVVKGSKQILDIL